jgi:hypothetical protein
MKMILSSLNLVRKVNVCITSDENGESKLTSEENSFNNFTTLTIYYLLKKKKLLHSLGLVLQIYEGRVDQLNRL